MSDAKSDAPIRSTDKVSDVLARNESLVDVFVRLSPAFTKLRSATMRRVMARLVTVEQAARMAHLSPEVVVDELNAALGTTPSTPGDAPATVHVEPPPASIDGDTHPPLADVVELDLRAQLRAGVEPFSTIMDTVAKLARGDVLLLRAIFEPVPLFSVLGKRGFRHEAICHAAEDWSVWFWRPDDNVIWLDVRGLEPPQPLRRTLEALDALPPGYELVHVNSRVPLVLLPMLAEQGFLCSVDETRADGVRVRIRRAP
jgi:hypothetical protein